VKSIRINAQLVALGTIEDGSTRNGAVFECSNAESVRKLAAALQHDLELCVTYSDQTENAGAGGPGLMPAECPCCQAEVLIATVQIPAVMRVFVERDETEHVAEYDDGHLAILRTYRLHAPQCPSWPAGDRDWRGNCR
jgi:hypothetical protein